MLLIAAFLRADNNTKELALMMPDSPDTKAKTHNCKEVIVNQFIAKKKNPSRFHLDANKERETFNLALDILAKANKKDRGREVTFGDVVDYAFSKLRPRDIEKIKERSLSEMEKVERLLAEYNRNRGANLTLGEFLAKKLKIS